MRPNKDRNIRMYVKHKSPKKKKKKDSLINNVETLQQNIENCSFPLNQGIIMAFDLPKALFTPANQKETWKDVHNNKLVEAVGNIFPFSFIIIFHNK